MVCWMVYIKLMFRYKAIKIYCGGGVQHFLVDPVPISGERSTTPLKTSIEK